MNQNDEFNGKTLPTPEEQAKIFSAKSHRHRIRLVSRVAYFVVVMLVLVLVFFLISKIFFSVDAIIVNGSTVYTPSRVIEASGAEEGDIIFSLDKEEIRSNIMSALPFISSVDIEKKFPGTLIIDVSDEKEQFYFEFGGRYFVISAGLKVLDILDSAKEVENKYEDSVFVSLDEIKRCVKTEEVVFFDSESARRSKNVLLAICSSSLYEKVDSVDLADLYNVSLIYDGRIKIVFESHIDIEKKLTNAQAIISRYSESAKGTVYVYDTDKGYAVLE